MSTSSHDDPILLQNAFKKIAYLKEDIRRLSDELRRKETQLSSFSEELQSKEAVLSNYTDLAAEQSKQISTLSAVIQDTILWDSTCPRPAASSTPSPLWTEVFRNRKRLHGRCSSPPRLNLNNRYSILSEVGSQTGTPEAALGPTLHADSSTSAASSRQTATT